MDRDSCITMIPTAGFSNDLNFDAGGKHTIVIRSNGSIGISGTSDNTWGTYNTPGGLSDLISVAAGEDFSVALQSDGTLTYWGREYFSNWVEALENVIQISAGQNSFIALHEDGSVSYNIAGGGNASNVGSDGIKAVTSQEGNGHMVLKSNGSIQSYGGSLSFGESNYIDVSYGALHAVALRSNGSIHNLSLIHI